MEKGDSEKVMENMEKRIELERRGKSIDQIKDLNLDNCHSTQLYGLSDEYVNLTTLSLINVGLTTLKGFPNLPNLRKLELSDNRLCGTLNLLAGCTNLTYLNLSGNKIKDLDALEPLKAMTELKNLDLFNCEVTNADGYREKVFAIIPSLVFLDGYDKDEKENEDSDEENGDSDDSGEEGAHENGDGASGDEDVDDNDDDDDDDDEDEEEDDEEDEDEPGLEMLAKSGLEDDSEGEDYEPNGTVDSEEEDEDNESDLEAEQGASPAAAVEGGRGIKRKRTDDGAPDGASNGDN